MKYIDAERLKAHIQHLIKKDNYELFDVPELLSFIDSLQQEQTDMGEVSDGYHTFNELYYYRMLYNAAFFNLLPKEWVHKSKRHHNGEECFGGGWFIVIANLPTGQISNHYELKDWDLFKVPVKEFADEWDGHTPQEAADRLHKYLQQEQPEVDLEKEIEEHAIYMPHGEFVSDNEIIEDMEWARKEFRHFYELGRQAKPEVFDTVAFQKGVQEGRRLEREEMPKWRNYGPNIIKDPFITDLGSLVVGEKCIRIYELYNLPGFKND